MAKPTTLQPLSFEELVMRADAATLKAAYEARLKVDTLLAEREEAYRRIAQLEQQVDALMGESGVFVFPEPPLPVAGFKMPVPKPVKNSGEASAKPPVAEDDATEKEGDAAETRKSPKK